MNTLELSIAWDKEHVTIRYNAEEKLICEEWRGQIPSEQLRAAMVHSCEFIMTNEVELVLADYTLLLVPSMEDQVWIANHFAELLHHSKLRKVANLMAQDLFQQLTISTIYDVESGEALPCQSRDFNSKEEAMGWLLAK